MKILITGGAGFVGSSLARNFKRRYPKARVAAFDNLRRRGSELNLAAFRREGVEFFHGDVRCPSDLADLPGNFDVLVEASAEPSVHSGMAGSPSYVVDTNLTGAVNCLEFARKRTKAFVFLSTSRVYSIAPLKGLSLRETESRFEIKGKQSLPGAGPAGISENFPTDLPRSIYGATKLSAEMMVQEYVEAHGLRAVLNRCGVIAGPGQFGRTDQGVFTLWMARHYFGKPLKYTGFGGHGKQVRDILHPDDLFGLIDAQLSRPSKLQGQAYNVGGGRAVSTSLLEWTRLCQKTTGMTVKVGRDPKTAAVDIPLYISDSAKARKAFGWRPRKTTEDIARDIQAWLRGNEKTLKDIF